MGSLRDERARASRPRRGRSGARRVAAVPTIQSLAKAYPRLPRSERLVADFILEHPDEVPRLTSTELGRRAGVSQSIVSRLCQRVYDGGYGALRLGLAQELAVAETAHRDRPATDTAGDDEILRRTTDEFAVAERAVALLDREQLRDVARLLCDAPAIVACGMAFSGAVSQRLAHLLHLAGLPARVEREPYASPYSVGLTSGSVLIATSYRGEAPALLQLIEHAQDQGAILLLITNETRSRLARRADVVIASHAPSVSTDEEWATSAAPYVQVAVAKAIWLAVAAEMGRRTQ